MNKEDILPVLRSWNKKRSEFNHHHVKKAVECCIMDIQKLCNSKGIEITHAEITD